MAAETKSCNSGAGKEKRGLILVSTRFLGAGMTEPADITVYWSDLGIRSGAKMKARDLWAGQDVVGTFVGRIEAKAVPVHGVLVYRLSAA